MRWVDFDDGDFVVASILSAMSSLGEVDARKYTS